MPGKFVDNMTGQAGLQNQVEFSLVLAETLRDLLFEAGVQSNGPNSAALPLKRANDLRSERATGVFGEFIGVFGDERVIRDFLEDAREIPNGNSFSEQVLQYA